MGESGGKTAPHGCLPPEGPTAAPTALLSGMGILSEREWGTALCWGCPQDSLGLPGWADLTFLRHSQKIRHSGSWGSCGSARWKLSHLPKFPHTPLQKIFQFLYGRSHTIMNNNCMRQYQKMLAEILQAKKPISTYHITCKAFFKVTPLCQLGWHGIPLFAQTHYFELPVITVILNTTGEGSRGREEGMFPPPIKTPRFTFITVTDLQ